MPSAPGHSLRGSDLLLHLHIQPRASQEGYAGEHGGRLKLRVHAPPVHGAANARVIELLAKLLDLPRSSLTIARGVTSRDKDVLVAGGAARAEQLIAALKCNRLGRF